MLASDSRVLVLGIDPGTTRAASLAAWSILSLDPASGTIGVVRQAVHLSKAELEEYLHTEPLLSDPRLGLVAMAAPMTPIPLERKPWRARSVEIRFARGAFSGVARGPWMPWLSSPRTWPRYQRVLRLQEALRQRDLPLLTMPGDEEDFALCSRTVVEVYPKATLAVLMTREPLTERPPAHRFLGELDDWLFPRLFTASECSLLPVQARLQEMGSGLLLSYDVIQEARRIALLRRPFPRREPMRAFTAAFQGILALDGGACLVGALGDHEGSIVLPAVWHPDWETDWSDSRRSVQVLRRLPIRPPSGGSRQSLFLSALPPAEKPFTRRPVPAARPVTHHQPPQDNASSVHPSFSPEDSL